MLAVWCAQKTAAARARLEMRTAIIGRAAQRMEHTVAELQVPAMPPQGRWRPYHPPTPPMAKRGKEHVAQVCMPMRPVYRIPKGAMHVQPVVGLALPRPVSDEFGGVRLEF